MAATEHITERRTSWRDNPALLAAFRIFRLRADEICNPFDDCEGLTVSKVHRYDGDIDFVIGVRGRKVLKYGNIKNPETAVAYCLELRSRGIHNYKPRKLPPEVALMEKQS